MISYRYLVIFSLAGIISSSYICPEYTQQLSTKNEFDASVPPSEVIVYTSECVGCLGSIKNGQFKNSCIKNGTHYGAKYCNSKKALNCDKETCCCKGSNCYDELRKNFASTPSKSSIPCLVQRKTHGDSSSSSNESYWRNSCDICVADYRGDAIESRCIESGDLVSECSSAIELVGGNLACTSNSKKCCCRSSDCQTQFEAYFFKEGSLGESLISEPYVPQPKIPASTATKSSASTLFWINCALIYLFIIL